MINNNKILEPKELELLKYLMQSTQDELIERTEAYLVGLYSEERVVGTDDYVYAIGDIPILLVAHLDTVHLYKPDEILYDKEANVMWSPQGIGADDRAGVYAVLRLLINGHRPYVLFTTDEEVGGTGAQIASLQIEPEVNFIIQLDRRGEKDSVYYDCDNPEFEKYINKFGFETAIGSFSDISCLCPKWKVAGVNLSIGYMDEHTKHERLYVSHMHNTIDKVEQILLQVKDEDKFEYKESSYGGYHSFLNNWDRVDLGYGNKQKVDQHFGRDLEICHGCFGDFPPEMIIDMGREGTFCGDCFSKTFTTCIKCQTVFADKTKTHLHCEECRKEA